MSSERFHGPLITGDRRATRAGRYVSPAPPGATSPPRRPAPGAAWDEQPAVRWPPQHWPLRAKLVALAGVPLLLAVVLGVLRVLDAGDRPHSTALRDLVI